MSRALTDLLARLAEQLEGRRAAGLYREPALGAGLDLTSNDYLGLARDPELAAAVAVGVRTHGAGGAAARLLGGHAPLFDEAERVLAAMSGRPASLLFTSGFAANVGLIPALAGPGDLIASDALNHASLIDGIRLSRAERAIFPHGDLDALAAVLARPRQGRAIVVTESLFSMDGDLTDLVGLVEVAEAHDAVVVVDEAHATGLYGARGSGRVEALGLSERVLCTIHTGGKALGVGGAWIAGERPLIAHLVNHARSFIYSTAPLPALAIGLMASLDRIRRSPQRVADVHAKAARLRERLRSAGLDLCGSASQIVPVKLGTSAAALEASRRLRALDFDVRAVRPPTVPEGTARVRLSVHADHPDEALERLADALIKVVRELS